MYTKRYVCFLLLGAVLLVTGRASAQIVKRGQAGFRFLENPISAEAVGRGGIGATMLDNATAVFWNPAELGSIRKGLDMGLHYTFGQADIDQVSGALAANLGALGVVGVSLTRMEYGTLHRTRRAAGDLGFEETGTFSPDAFAVGLAYARAMSDRFSFGVHFKLARQSLGGAWIAPVQNGTVSETRLKEYAKTVPALDAGASYDFQAYGVTVGAAIQNVSQEVRYEQEQFSLPFRIRFSMTADPLALTGVDLGRHDLTLASETWKGRDFQQRLQFGAEYSFMDAFFVRTGYMSGYSERGLTLGVGLKQYGVQFDYAYQRFGVFGGIHLLSLNSSFGG